MNSNSDKVDPSLSTQRIFDLTKAKDEGGVEIKLNGADAREDRIALIARLSDTAQKLLEAVNSYRTKNRHYMFLTFVGYYAFLLKFLKDSDPLSVATPFFVIMLAFVLSEHTYHKYCHGWLLTIKCLARAEVSVINEPKRTVKFMTYYREGGKRVWEWEDLTSPSRLPYYLMLVGSVLSYFVIRYRLIEVVEGKT